MNRLPPSTGWLWLKEGFGLFRQQPGLLTMLVFANVLFALLMMQFQLAGSIVFPLLIPSISMITYEACRVLASGERLTPAVLGTGFRKASFGPLCRLGAVYFGVSIVMALLMYLMVDLEAVAKAAEIAQKTKQPIVQALAPSQLFAFLGFMLATFAMMAALCFAPPLVHWKKMPTFKAVFYSVFAVIGSIGPLGLMFASWFMGWLLIMMFGTLIIGKNAIGVVALTWLHLVMVAILQCSLYAAYRQLLPDSK